MTKKEQERQCIKVQVLKTEARGDYRLMVVENLDATSDSNRYIMCTRCPNWNGKDPEIGQTGFMSYVSVVAGRDKWYNPTDKQHYHYRYTADYFLDFVPLTLS